MLDGKEGLECEIHVDGAQLEQVSEFKYLDESGTDFAEFHRKVVSRRKVVGAIKSLLNVSSLQLEYARVLHKGLRVLILLYGIVAIIWRVKKKPRIRAVHMDTLRGLLDMRMEKVLKA